MSVSADFKEFPHLFILLYDCVCVCTYMFLAVALANPTPNQLHRVHRISGFRLCTISAYVLHIFNYRGNRVQPGFLGPLNELRDVTCGEGLGH